MKGLPAIQDKALRRGDLGFPMKRDREELRELKARKAASRGASPSHRVIGEKLLGLHVIAGTLVELSLKVLRVVHPFSMHDHVPSVQLIPVVVAINPRMRQQFSE